MNNKDKEAFDNWFAREFKKCAGESCGREFISLHDEFTKSWQAACEYKQKEYSNLIDAMTQTSQNNAKLVAENKKLREALEFYANCTRLILDVKNLPIDPILGAPMFSSKSIMDNGDRAREALKEVDQT